MQFLQKFLQTPALQDKYREIMMQNQQQQVQQLNNAIAEANQVDKEMETFDEALYNQQQQDAQALL